MKFEYDVLVLGAGAAGLSAAAKIHQAGLKVGTVEARRRTGGRIHTLLEEGIYPVELGAEFVHGRPACLKAFEEFADAVPPVWWRRRGKHLVRADDIFKHIEKVFHELRLALGGREMPFGPAIGSLEGRFPEEWLEQTRAFVAGFYAAPLDTVSAQSVIAVPPALGNAASDDAFRLRCGYSRVLQPFLKTLPERTLHLGCAVYEIDWAPGAVIFRYQDAEGQGELHARQAVITTPVGCWGKVEFHPPIAAKQEAIKKIGMGQIHRVVLRFREAFWEHGDFHPGYLQSDARPFVTFWTSRPWPEARFTCWSGGSQTAGVGASPKAQAQRALADALGVSVARVESELIDAYYHDWGADPYAGGAYSFRRADAEDAVERLVEPVADTLFFAGEACHLGDRTGTVDGAIETGTLAALQVLARAGVRAQKAS